MLLIGENVKFNKDTQLLGSVEEALSYNSTTFMFYTGTPQNTVRSNIDDDITNKAIELMKKNNIDYSKVVVHAPYIINLGNNKEMSKFNFSVDFLTNEVKRCERLGIKYMVLHPGSHVGLGNDIAIKNIITGLNKVLESVTTDIKILLETMAGKGTEIGSNFGELSAIIDGVGKKENIGVCMDTCHLNDAGYDLEDFDSLLNLFDKEIGLNYLYCIHVNDSKNEKGTHKDRHENLGYGKIGFETLINIIYHEKLKDIPKILETPYINGNAPYKYEIEMIRKKKFDNKLIEKASNLE